MEQFFTGAIRRYYEIELPHGRDARGHSHKRWPLLIALHGYEGDMTSMMRVARRIGDGKMIVLAPQGPNQFLIGNDALKHHRIGFGWGTTWKMEDSIALHHADLRALIDRAVRRHRAARTQVFLLAFSQACAYNYRFVFTYPRAIRGVIGVCGGVPGDWESNPGYQPAQTHVLHIGATRDKWYSRERNLEFRRKLAQRAASLDFRFYNSTHKFPRASIAHIRKWIERHL